jgi:hypothetical protein
MGTETHDEDLGIVCGDGLRGVDGDEDEDEVGGLTRDDVSHQQ